MSTNESKGRPTPKRKEAESKRKVSSLAPIVTKDQKRASKALSKQDRIAQRAAYLRGDEAALPLRDRGASRRFVRDYVDSRRSTGEYFLPTIFIVLVLTLFPVPAIQLGAIALMYAMLIIAIIVIICPFLCQNAMSGCDMGSLSCLQVCQNSPRMRG